MSTTLEFRIQNLLEKKDGKISAPMSPMLFVQEVTKLIGEKFNRLARVWFEDETIHQRKEDGGYTGHDILIIGAQYSDDLKLTLWVDEGMGGVPVAMEFQSDGELIITPIYHNTQYHRKLSNEQIKEIFNHLFENPQLLKIKEKTDPASK